jgi:formate/nitrite transporter FocA (FNT family)
MFGNIIKIAILCIVMGGASIPVAFTIDSNPFVVWFGNALGSLISAFVVIYVSNRITDDKFKKKVSKWRIGKKIVITYEDSSENKHVDKARIFVNKHGLRLFSLLCPIFPGVLVSTIAVYALDLNKKLYVRWMLVGVFFVSGAYVFAYWFAFQRT